jgi:uncharacterized tellurite resistance protein B-like protein
LNPIITLTARTAIHLRLPLIELVITALKQLSETQKQHFILCLNLMIQADEKISIMEWAIYRIVINNLQPKHQPLRLRSLQDSHEDCQLLISLLAYSGARQQEDAEAAFALARSALPFNQFTLLTRSVIKLNAMDAALERLKQLKPLQKPQLLKAMGFCVMHDGILNTTEAELFRALADGLDCPIPPQLAAMPITATNF